MTYPPTPYEIIERTGTTFMVVDADGNHIATVSGRKMSEMVCKACEFWAHLNMAGDTER